MQASKHSPSTHGRSFSLLPLHCTRDSRLYSLSSVPWWSAPTSWHHVLAAPLPTFSSACQISPCQIWTMPRRIYISELRTYILSPVINIYSSNDNKLQQTGRACSTYLLIQSHWSWCQRRRAFIYFWNTGRFIPRQEASILADSVSLLWATYFLSMLQRQRGSRTLRTLKEWVCTVG
jgi:hypothetical protein